MDGKIYHVMVGFEVSCDVPNVCPPFKKGERDSVWVTSKSTKGSDILEAAKRKLEFCYGLELLNPTIYGGGFWS